VSAAVWLTQHPSVKRNVVCTARALLAVQLGCLLDDGELDVGVGELRSLILTPKAHSLLFCQRGSFDTEEGFLNNDMHNVSWLGNIAPTGTTENVTRQSRSCVDSSLTCGLDP